MNKIVLKINIFLFFLFFLFLIKPKILCDKNKKFKCFGISKNKIMITPVHISLFITLVISFFL